TELVERVASDGWDDDDPVWAPTGPVPTVGDASGREPARSPIVVTDQLPETEPVTEVRMEPVADDPWSDVVAAPATAQMPTAVPVGPAPEPHHRFRFTAVTFLGVLGGVVLLVGLFASVVEISANRPLTIGADAPAGFGLGSWIADDLA